METLVDNVVCTAYPLFLIRGETHLDIPILVFASYESFARRSIEDVTLGVRCVLQKYWMPFHLT